MRHAFEPIYSRPLIIIECNKRPLRCILDTGYPGTIWMGRENAARYGIRPSGRDYFATTGSGAQAKYNLGFAQVFLDPVRFENLPIEVHEGHHVEYALLGTRMLRDFVVTLDFKDGYTDLQYID